MDPRDDHPKVNILLCFVTPTAAGQPRQVRYCRYVDGKLVACDASAGEEEFNERQ
jgi:hypothetical protein